MVVASLATTADPEGRWCVALLLGSYPSTAQLPSLEQFLTDVDDDVRGLAENLCLRSLGQILNPFLMPDPWRTWAEQHYSAWSANHRDRVRELIKTKVRGR